MRRYIDSTESSGHKNCFGKLLLSFLVNEQMLEGGDILCTGWSLWNVHNTFREDLFNESDQLARNKTRKMSTTPGSNTVERDIHWFTILLHSQGQKDKDAFRVYTQLSTNIPDNSSALKLLSLHNFYELYWILTNNIFKTYGMSSLMAEAELTKLLMIIYCLMECYPARQKFLDSNR